MIPALQWHMQCARRCLELLAAGNWASARQALSELRTARKDASGAGIVDGPSNTLLEFMAVHKFEAPPSWPGYRELTEK